MATQIGSLVVDLTLKFAKFSSDLEKASGQVTKSATSIQRTMTAMGTAVGAVLTARAIKQMVRFTEESLKLASTLDNNLGRSAKNFINNAEAMGNSFKLGVAQGLIISLQKGLEKTGITMEGLAKTGLIVGQVLGTAFTVAVDVLTILLPEALKLAAENMNVLIGLINQGLTKLNELNEWFNTSRVGRALGLEKTSGNFSLIPTIDTSGIVAGVAGMFNLAGASDIARDSLTLTTEQMKEADAAAARAGKTFTDLANMSNAAFEKSRTPMEKYAAAIEHLNFMLKEGGIDAETYKRLHVMSAAETAGAWLQVADQVGNALGTMFKENKAVAIAQAVINTAQGITQALAAYPPPFSFAMAAAVAAAGAAQIATIMSAQPGTSKKPTAGSGAGAAAGSKKGQGRTSTSQSGGQSVYVQLNGGPMFSQEAVRGLISQINEAVGDGATIRMA